MKTRRCATGAVAGPLLIAAGAAPAHEAAVHVHLADGTPLFLGVGATLLALVVTAAVFVLRERRERRRSVRLDPRSRSRHRSR
jgi:hypothetical protein